MAMLRGVVVFGFVVGLGACGGAPAPKSPASQATDVDTLARELEDAERALSAGLGAPPATPSAAEPGAAPAPSDGGEGGPEEKKSSEPSTPSPEPAATQTEKAQQSSPCETACKALASMRRSQARICELAGEAHERCEWAKQRVAEAVTRVEKAGCECSG